MRIKKHMINWLEAMKAIPIEKAPPSGLLPSYMEYPKTTKELQYVMQWHIRGRSVHSILYDEPIIIKRKDTVDVIPIEELVPQSATGEFIKAMKGIKVWSKDGFTEIKGISRHLASKNVIKKVCTRKGILDVSTSHSLMRNNEPVLVSSLTEGLSIDHVNLPILVGDLDVDKEYAWALGFFLAEGSARITKYPKRRSNGTFKNSYCTVTSTSLEYLRKFNLGMSKVGFCFRTFKFPSNGNVFVSKACKNVESIARLTHSWFYNRRDGKKLPAFVYSWNRKSQEAFLNGYLAGDGSHFKKFTTKDKTVALGIIILAHNLGIDFSCWFQDNPRPHFKVNFISHSRKNPFEIISIRDFKGLSPKTGLGRRKWYRNKLKVSRNTYLYDLSTDNSLFHAGVGCLLAHNTDFRMEINDHLVGWTILTPGGIPKEAHTIEEGREAVKKIGIEFSSEKKDKGFRAETKAAQPKVWLTVEGIVKPGQVGACLSGNELVLTLDGLKPLKSINKGDLVLSHDGRFHKVLETIKTEKDKRRCFLLSMGKGLKEIIATEDHPFLIGTLKYHGRHLANEISEIQFLTAKEIFDLKEHTHWQEKYKLLSPVIPESSKIGTFELGLLAGFTLGDGYLKEGARIEWCFNTNEGRLARYYQHILSQKGIESHVDRIRDTIQISFVDTELKNIILDLETSPSHIFKYSKEFARGVYEGLLDADGYRNSITTNKETVKKLLPLAIVYADMFYSFCQDQGNSTWVVTGDKAVLSQDSKWKLESFDIKEVTPLETTYNLTVEGTENYFLPNCISHNTKEHPGVFVIVDTGRVYFGAQKPYFHEYFLKSNKKDGPFTSKDWTRVVVRAVNVQVIDPETKLPRPGTELMWRVIVPGDQVPYALKRGLEKKWVPPKGYIPIPPEWRTGKEYEAWEKWVKDAWKEKVSKTEEEKEGKALELKATEFVVHYLSYMGQIVVRGIPNQRWFLRLKEGDKVHSWASDIDFTKFSPVALEYEGTVDDKWFDYEGDIGPNTKYNPSKTLTAKMVIVDQGSCSINKELVDGAERLLVDFHGRELIGKHVIAQEEQRSPMYSIEKLPENLEAATFVLQLHEIKTDEKLKQHWDIRIDKGFEFNIWGNPLELTEEGMGHKANYKICRDVKTWMEIKEPKTKMMVGPLETYVTPIDKGKVTLIEQNIPRFVSMQFEGEKLKGYFVYIEHDGIGRFERAKVPHPLSSGNPSTGDYFKPFKEIRKQGWDYFWLEIYDLKEFTRCVENPEKYLPDLSKPPEVLEMLICLYPRPETIHGARVSRVKFSDKWSVTQASDWIKKNKLHTWQGELIREQHQNIEDEVLAKIIDEELKKREKTPEEKRIELELKKKKLELIEKWLQANSGE